MLLNRQMKGLNDAPLIGFIIYFTFILFILSDTVNTVDAINVYDILNKTNTVKLVYNRTNCVKTYHYYYELTVCVDKPDKVVLADFRKHVKSNSILESSFPIEYYGEKYGYIQITQQGTIYVNEMPLRLIEVLRGEPRPTKMEIVNNREMFAVRWSNLTVISKGKSYQVTVSCMIYRESGNINVYYENISSEINSSSLITSIQDIARLIVDKVYVDKFVYSKITVPSTMIKSNSLVIFKPLKHYCSKQKNKESCQLASEENIICYWCPIIKNCTNGADLNAIKFSDSKCFRQVSTGLL
ncbi:Egg protein [Schistosoma japonicum]|nr:Egg protein [Schistosoma japonicum]